MKTLKDYIYNSLEYSLTFDAHIHCIGGKEIPRTANVQVCALNDWPDEPRKENYSEFEKYFKKNSEDLVLGIWANDEEMRKMLQDDRFAGYGEFLAYKILKDGKVVNKLNVIKRQISSIKKPVYIHFDLTEKNVYQFEKFLQALPDSKIVLCHCGLSRRTDDNTAFNLFVKLCSQYSNLWGDISWHTLTYIIENPQKIKEIPQNKVICGTDCSERDSETALKHRKENFEKISKMIPNTYNIKTLFNI